MDPKAEHNREKQCNPNHPPTGPGHTAGYKGTGTKDDLDNHSKQLNPNNPLYKNIPIQLDKKTEDCLV